MPKVDASLSLVMLYCGMIGVFLVWYTVTYAVEVSDPRSTTVSLTMSQPQNHAGIADS